MNNEIKTIEQAKRYFISMGCSHFHLDREDFDRAKEYRALKISSSTESTWRQEEFDKQLSNFYNTDKSKFGLTFSSLAYITETTEYYLQHLSDLIIQINDKISKDQIRTVLSTIIGNDSTNTHGGLIQKAYGIRRKDLQHSFIECSLTLIDRADKEKVDITFLRNNLADIIDHFKITELNDIAYKLRQNDEIQGFIYYEIGALEGNRFAMNMLSKYYREGKGCKVDLEKAKHWEQKAKQ
jgi:hypothetical protein